MPSASIHLEAFVFAVSFGIVGGILAMALVVAHAFLNKASRENIRRRGLLRSARQMFLH